EMPAMRVPWIPSNPAWGASMAQAPKRGNGPTRRAESIFDARCRGNDMLRPILEKALRVDVELHLDRAALLRSVLHHCPHEALHVGAAPAVDEQAEAVAAAHQGQRRLGRPEHRN